LEYVVIKPDNHALSKLKESGRFWVVQLCSAPGARLSPAAAATTVNKSVESFVASTIIGSVAAGTAALREGGGAKWRPFWD